MPEKSNYKEIIADRILVETNKHTNAKNMAEYNCILLKNCKKLGIA